MKSTILIISAVVLASLISCNNPTKNEDAEVSVEPGTDISQETEDDLNITEDEIVTDSIITYSEQIQQQKKEISDHKELIGYWVGDFENAEDNAYEKAVYADLYQWNRTNKINISLDYIEGNKVEGHSVVAGNDRPFKGTIVENANNKIRIMAKEPGDDKYDGTFDFTVSLSELKGTWEAYNDLDIKHRKYTLEKKTFAYNPDQELEHAQIYIDWTEKKTSKTSYDYGDGDTEVWIEETFASATEKMYEINASNTKLTAEVVENLKKGDLVIIRNAIYARHGYSFKNRPLRVFFDAQSWYIPVHTDIKSDFTELEKENIKLLLKYEKNAAEYYDSFGRG